ncbi:hypothetical protein AMAG_18645 [Allomyces macrogynus ATCC 38327]|uniref:Uncharacterized protein n=1 Tax=Allomyces macrogynus (strain ATCC 38327) TaxID=578462 RepID=A0A0L0SGB2_ALLM3|nr:hypothetical protein AMAG_18645 [Allomyces macrogynus ATCC 38327]|eukprot:KNE61548.1 hypothetical protein AMAG_18645 [Allomyces macrogynus ATCC 38327]
MRSPAPPPPIAVAAPAPTAPNGMTPPIIGLTYSPVPMVLDPSRGASATPVPTPPAPAAPAPPSTENPVAYTQWLLSIIKSASSAPYDSGSPAPTGNPGAAHALPTPSSLNGSHGSLPSLLGPAPPPLLDLASRLPSLQAPNVPNTDAKMSRPAQPPAISLASDASHLPSLLDPCRPPSAAGIHPLLGTPSVTSSSYMPPPPLSHTASSPAPARPCAAAAAPPPPPPITEAQVLLLVAQAVRPIQEMQSMLVQSSHAASARVDALDADVRSVRTDLARAPASSSAATDAAVRLLRDEVTALKEVLANERVDHAVLKHDVAEERKELARVMQAVQAERDELVALKQALGAERVALVDLRERLEVEKTVAKVWSLIEDAPAAELESRMEAVATPIPAGPPLRVPPSEPGSPPVQIIELAAPPPPVAVDTDPMLVDTPVPPAGFNAHVRSPTAPRHPNETTLTVAMDVALPTVPAPPELVAAPATPSSSRG